MINYNIRIKRASSSRWNSINPILSAGELGLETNTGKIKAGNGSATWSQLNYIGPDNTELLIPTRNYYGYVGDGYWDDLTKWVVFDGNNNETIWDGTPATQLPTENDNVVVHGQINGSKNSIKIYNLILESYKEEQGGDILSFSSYLSGLSIICNTFVCDSTAYNNSNEEPFYEPWPTYTINGTDITTNYAYFTGFGEGGNGGVINSPLTLLESNNLNTGIINGNVILFLSTNIGKINGNIELYTSSENNNIIIGNGFFNDNSANFGTVSGNASFLDNSINDGDVGDQENNSLIINGLASFFDESINMFTISGNVVYYDDAIDNS
jgi:hypothetical protein